MITGDKFLTYAKRILSSPSIPEEEVRSAMSRAYYSLYHQTLDIAVRKCSLDLIRVVERHKKRRLKWYEKNQLNSLDPQFLRTCNFHRILPDTLINIKEPVLAISFKSFRDQRNKADYDLRETITQTDAATVVNNIGVLVSQITSL